MLGHVLREGHNRLYAFPNPRRTSDYKITITREQAAKGLEKDLSRNGKQLRVIIPPNIKSGTRIRLPNARFTTDGIPGDIFIMVYVKKNKP
jgi:hypothetical protein